MAVNSSPTISSPDTRRRCGPWSSQGGRTITYLLPTALLVVLGLLSGVGDLARTPVVTADLEQLGYPVYVATILGVAKVFGVLAVAAPGRAGLKEWAYAGFVFDFAGAVASSLAVGVLDSDTALATVALVVTTASYLAHHARVRFGGALGVAALRSRASAVPARAGRG